MKRGTLICSIVCLLSGCGGSAETEKRAVDTIKTNAIQIVQTPIENPFNKEVTYKKIKLTVSSPGKSVENSFTINPSGYTAVNSPVTEHIEGKVSDVLVDDIDGDGYPEWAVIINSGKDESANVFVYSSNGDKSMSSVNFPVIGKDDKILSGYKGHDEFNFVEGSFIRRFPLYDGDTKTGKMRQVQYKLKNGEALKQLVQQKIIDY
jgi:hypothetical protein